MIDWRERIRRRGRGVALIFSVALLLYVWGVHDFRTCGSTGPASPWPREGCFGSADVQTESAQLGGFALLLLAPGLSAVYFLAPED